MGGEAFSLMMHIDHDYIQSPLYFVLDEVQIPARLYREAYRSDAKPIPCEILSAWKIRPHNIIISGTLSEKPDQAKALSVKSQKKILATPLGLK